MKKLNELYDCEYDNVVVNGIKMNSKEVVKDDLFICTKGVTTDRHDFVDDQFALCLTKASPAKQNHEEKQCFLHEMLRTTI